MNKFFLDAEFTDFHEPRLISLGIYADGGQAFYGELERATWYDWSSAFVLDEIVPHLGREGVTPESRQALADRLRAWCARFRDGEISVVVDFHTDWDLLEALLLETGPWPANLNRQPLYFEPQALDQAKGWGCVQARDDSYRQLKLTRHHALDDARALWASWRHAEKMKRRP